MHRSCVARKRRRERDADEPSFDGLELEEMGGELIHVIDRTEGGAPYGPTLAELRRDAERHARGAGWARAKHVLRELLDLEGLAVRDIGRVSKIGDGLSRDVFAASVEHADGTDQAYAVLVPRRDADAELGERTVRELRLLAQLQGRVFPFRIPPLLGAMQDGKQVVLVRHCVQGVPLDLRAGRQHAVRPWEIVAEIAAAIHGVHGADVTDVAIGFETRRAHAIDQLSVFEGLDSPEMRAAHAWAREHLPPDDPATLVHGDLLGQNILLAFDGPHHVIDWEYALRGDPAYDLAIVTRGAKQPFQMAAGLDRLLESYEAHGGRGVTREHVQLHELCLVAHWYREALAGRGSQPPAFELDRMRALVRRLR